MNFIMKILPKLDLGKKIVYSVNPLTISFSNTALSQIPLVKSSMNIMILNLSFTHLD